MRKITIIVETAEEVDDILEVLTEAEEDGEIGFSFGVTVDEYESD